ncbi:hypothetical protein [Absidia glauca]|uniref:Uncharacterized protein n=1 Tax=Absidia glauca TaxID=4829 RepID=A0A168S229_ABSGL|nr:hypothetical protein [Absidia glauca]
MDLDKGLGSRDYSDETLAKIVLGALTFMAIARSKSMVHSGTRFAHHYGHLWRLQVAALFVIPFVITLD